MVTAGASNPDDQQPVVSRYSRSAMYCESQSWVIEILIFKRRRLPGENGGRPSAR
jgi:hypothetical protein